MNAITISFTVSSNWPACSPSFERFETASNGIAETGLAGQNTVPDEHADWLAERIQKTHEYARTQPNFRFGLTLLVQCGIGRGITMAMPRTKTEAWRTVPISVRDLITLSLVKNFSPLRLWKILDGEERLAQLGIMLQNHNGLLNLIAWVIDNEWHLAPHAKIPKEFRNSRGFLYIAPDFVLGLRQRVAIETDFLVATRIDGSPAIVRRIGDSEFPEDHLIPTYAEEHYSESAGIPLLVSSPSRFWWCHAIPASRQEVDYEHWQLMREWLPRIVSVIEPRLDQLLPEVVLLRVHFEVDDSNEDHPIPSRQSIERSIRAEIDRDHGVVSLNIGVEFQHAQASPINLAEREFVRAICQGFATLAHTHWEHQTLDTLEAAIVPNDDARHMHRFYVRRYRDGVANELSGRVVYLDELDVTGLQLGLAFRVESRLKGRALIRSKARCTEFLNALVRELENDLCQELRRFGRADFVKAAILNHERAQYQRRRWSRTARANLAFHGGTQEAMNVIATQEGELSGVILLSLLLVEVAICECPLTAIEKPESSDIAKLMALVHAIVITSGWSDAIHMDAMPPHVVIRPTGAVHVDTTFHNSVVMPFTELASASRIEGAMKSYDKNFQPLELIAADTPTSDSPTTDTKFEQAWKCEFGFYSEDLIKFVEAIEDIGARRQSAVFEIRKSQLIELVQQEAEITTAAIIIDVLTLFPRDGWRTLPPDIEAELQRSPAKAPTIRRPFEKDIQLGRFRRQFSVTRRPLVALQATDDPVMVIVPGHLRDGVRYIVDNYFEGSFPTSQIKSPEMRSWFGQRSNIDGLKFAQEVADKIRSLGWTTDRINWEVQAILGRGSDPVFGDLGRYGDVDVLAWNQSEKRILVIECKQLHYHKTPGEIAEQLSDFRGKMKRDGKARDDLLKHLDRMAVLKANSQKLCKRVGLPSDATIEGWIIFKNPVPMLYSWKQFESRIRIATFDDLPKVCRC